MRTHLNNKRIEVSGGGTTALTPALSPRRGRIVRRIFECCEFAVARSASVKLETAKRCSLSPGERVRVRASARTNCYLWRSIVRCVFLASLMTTLIGCSRGPRFLGSIQTAGGVEALKKECADLVSSFKASRPDFVEKTNCPPVVSKLNPQVVRIQEQRSFTFVAIQITGGFSHSGLLVSAQDLPPDFMPLQGGGGKWRVWKLADRVFEYRG